MPRRTVKQQRAADEDRFFADIIAEVAGQPQGDDDWYDYHTDSRNSLATDNSGTHSLSNLYPLIDRENVHGLNLAIPQLAKSVIKPWSEREDTIIYAESDVDDQVIIHVPFAQNVRVKSILLKLGD